MELFALSSLALVAGLVSFTAPCTLPLLPGYVSFVSGMRAQSGGGRSGTVGRTVAGASLFVLGFSTVFVALGLTASGLGLLLARQARLLEIVGGAFIVVMGLVTAGVLRVPILQRQLRYDLSRIGNGPRAAFPLGAAFAFGWTPCVGPVLAAVLATAASTATLTQGAVLLAAYSLGLGLPFLGLAVAVARGGGRLEWLRRHSRKIEVAGGLLLAVMGVAVMTGQWTVLMSRMLSLYARIGWPPI
ncbi:cytochrome c biogenesis CcdA family protein [Kribbella aluminosa]|uniref:cytochrome c biogenesis CcdA family protein n=1 Tax=Kribbella aluminosa TaxID=416017 RepID=UPI001AE59670|nr:cytochrome c biogenesis protein CcdA [Kribbella aluminosa]